MEENQIYIDLNKNLLDLESVENEISMLELAIYQKNIDDLKKIKLNEIKEFFTQQAKFYNQKSEKYSDEINTNIEKYKNEIEKIINAYDNMYITVFRIMANAINNQKIAIGNIVTLTEKLKKDDSDDEEKTRNTIIACAEKKLNYSVIIDECKARINWCRENIINDINDVFKNNVYQLQVYDKNIVNIIRRGFSNLFFGKSNYKKFLQNYKVYYLKDIEEKNKTKALDVWITTQGVIKQMEDAKKQISEKYNERIAA